ncbi:oligosaccharide flippase family protein [Bacillus sp. REN16]|uniref:oligosaccharide flippase family protein n=1 Tax=Bacillus sp. REN16 TaxID=2887296 RepID=UPI001E403E62|nr:oligosaccharide flippase family protein [Bacillus sp. REN16]MCC3356085.1 oligosaccharide flippase family protein [Bacillus sp. REN16]
MDLKKISLSRNIKNVGKISFGTILGQVISIVTLPIFTRIYGPAVIGNWALFYSLAIIVRSFSDLGLTNAIMMEKSEQLARNLYKVVSTLSIIISLIIGICLYNGLFLSGLGFNQIFLAVMLTVLFFTLQQIQISYTWLNRKKQYNVLMKNPILNNTVVTIFALFFGLCGYIEYGYYISLILGQIVTLFHMKRFLPKGFFCFEISEYKDFFKRHRQFVFYQMPSNIIMQFKGQLPTIFISMFFGSSMLGYYSVAMRVLGMPITLLANSIGKVFFQSASEIKRRGEQVGEFTLRIQKKAMKFSLLPMVLLLCIGDVVVMILFGAEFKISGNILRIMTLYGFFLFLSMSVNGIATVIDKQQYLMVSGIFQIVGISFGFWVGASIFNNIYISIFAFCLVFVIIQIIYFCTIFKQTNIKINRYLIPLIFSLIILLLSYSLIRLLLMILGIVNTM